MKTIEERAKEYSDRHKSIENNYFFKGYNYNYNIAEKYDAEKFAYEAGATEQKAIDLETVCNIFCHTGCPHKTDSYDCLKDKCDALKAFKRMMAE